MANPNCPKCHGAGFFKDSKGTVQTCWDCLREGNSDVHSEHVPDSKIKI